MAVKEKVRQFRAKLVELFSRSIEIVDTTKEIYRNGDDNDYPYRIERIINNSVTAKLCAGKMQDYLVGRGFGDETNALIINKSKNITLYKLLKDIARNYTYQNAFAVHVNYDFEGQPNMLEVIPFKKVRVSREDSFGNFGRIWVSDDWTKESDSKMKRRKSKSNTDQSSLRWYYPYNDNLEVINAQRKKDFELSGKSEDDFTPEQIALAMVQGYRGQIFYFNPQDENIYPNSLIDSAYNDADSEYRVSVFRNDQIRNKFIGAAVVTIEEQDTPVITDEQVRGLLGEDNASNILLVEVDRNEDGDLKEAIRVDTIKSEVDTDRFINDEQKIEENILNSFKNVPRILVKGSDASFFGSSGETLRVAEQIYQRNTQNERQDIEMQLSMLFRNFQGVQTPLSIIPLIDEENADNQSAEI